jgi:hypothetical protein
MYCYTIRYAALRNDTRLTNATGCFGRRLEHDPWLRIQPLTLYHPLQVLLTNAIHLFGFRVEHDPAHPGVGTEDAALAPDHFITPYHPLQVFADHCDTLVWF